MASFSEIRKTCIEGMLLAESLVNKMQEGNTKPHQETLDIYRGQLLAYRRIVHMIENIKMELDANDS
jgi:hypothetical protein